MRNRYNVNDLYSLIKEGLSNCLGVKFILIFTSAKDFFETKE